ncbi:hypothetical protein ACD589_14980 [Rhizobium sp. 814_E9_N1_1]|uniref:hypothetical protein n=1 Tax=Rhizobium sp. 814_E9_N1_1 TaxID=3276276 RepID=UPI003F27BD6E
MDVNSVTVFEREGKWIVALVENGEKTELDFRNEEFARNYAAGQSKRLSAPSHHRSSDQQD